MRSRVVAVYKDLLRFAEVNPNSKAILSQIRTDFRKHVNEADPAIVESLVKTAESKLGYLRTITPKIFHPAERLTGTYVYRDGQVVRGGGERPDGPYAIEKSLSPDPQDVQRFKAQWRKARRLGMA